MRIIVTLFVDRKAHSADISPEGVGVLTIGSAKEPRNHREKHIQNPSSKIKMGPHQVVFQANAEAESLGVTILNHGRGRAPMLSYQGSGVRKLQLPLSVSGGVVRLQLGPHAVTLLARES